MFKCRVEHFVPVSFDELTTCVVARDGPQMRNTGQEKGSRVVPRAKLLTCL